MEGVWPSALVCKKVREAQPRNVPNHELRAASIGLEVTLMKRMADIALLVVACLVVSRGTGFAQSSKPKFDVASVKASVVSPN